MANEMPESSGAVAMRQLRSLDDVNMAIESTACKLVVIRFGDGDDPLCMHTDELLTKAYFAVRNYVDVYTCERSDVKELVGAMGLDSALGIMCFFNKRHVKIDCSSGDNEKIDFAVGDEKIFIELFTLAYKAGVRNKRVVVSPFSLEELKNGW
ncbi:mitosis protein DIM1 [Ordospora pajunii]|jgi:DIM1 family U5 snRNP protein|uniref:mitosis protein DIM1 n=1 Tax=Ordospora pajunii TaxID=3039483 RepID=UPI002952748A|nr:mitosis protein DIM1 [Ordospora pajunii]KAH9411970.1 mitosis protein DIM1 [Ordospora pajunii]